MTAPEPESVLFGSEAAGHPIEWRIDFPRCGDVRPLGVFVRAADVSGQGDAVRQARARWPLFAREQRDPQGGVP